MGSKYNAYGADSIYKRQIVTTLDDGGTPPADIDVTHSQNRYAINVIVKDSSNTQINVNWKNKDNNTITILGFTGTEINAIIDILF